MGKDRKLEKRRVEALSTITGERLHVELMAQRPRGVDDPLDIALFEKLLKCLTDIEESARQATHLGTLDDLSDDAELHGTFRGYLCPVGEIEDEGLMAIALMEEWGVPKSETRKLRESLGQKLKKDPEDARGALRSLLEERGSWSDYTDDYEASMKRYTYGLFAAVIALPSLAVIAFHYAFLYSPLLFGGLFCAGAAGSCVSVMAKMPELDVRLSSELDAYGRRVLSRIGVGLAASLIGCALLGWGLLPISLQGQTFREVLNSCTTSAQSCTGTQALILVGVPMLLGFSERALTSFEQRIFGNWNRSQKAKP
jgi:hypothetical protein